MLGTWPRRGRGLGFQEESLPWVRTGTFYASVAAPACVSLPPAVISVSWCAVLLVSLRLHPAYTPAWTDLNRIFCF